MKKAIIMACMALAFGVTAQEKDSIASTNEIKLNATNLIGFQYLDLIYEHILNDDTSVGVSFVVKVGNDIDVLEFRRLSITPYYRLFFSKGDARGFFVEAFGMYNNGVELIYDFDIGQDVEEEYDDFAFGISVGGKFINRKRLLAEIYGGIGRNLFNGEFTPQIVTRGGVSIGYRF